MDEQNKTQGEQQNMCGCAMCKGWGGMHGMHWRRHSLLRIFIGLVAMLVVFMVGIKVGEFKAEMKNYYYYRNFKGGMMQQQFQGMMQPSQGYFYYQR